MSDENGEWKSDRCIQQIDANSCIHQVESDHDFHQCNVVERKCNADDEYVIENPVQPLCTAALQNKGARQCHNEQKDRAQQRIAEAVAKANQQISALDHFQIIRKLPDGGKMKAHAV